MPIFKMPIVTDEQVTQAIRETVAVQKILRTLQRVAPEKRAAIFTAAMLITEVGQKSQEV